MVLMTAAAISASGCAVSRKTATKPSEAPVPLQTATKAELISRYNHQAEAISSINAAVTMKLTAGSAYTGVIEQYHEVNGFILAQRPSQIRVIGQAPVIGKDIFDMVSDGKTFRIFIPSKNKFIVGPTNIQRKAEKPAENLRPQHLLNAIFEEEIPSDAPVLFEEASEDGSEYYVLTVVEPEGEQGTANASAAASWNWEIEEKIWFERNDLQVARLETYGSGGQVDSDVGYSQWTNFGGREYPGQILLIRPEDDYRLRIEVKRLTANEPISADRFNLPQPPGSELVRVGEEPKEPKP